MMLRLLFIGAICLPLVDAFGSSISGFGGSVLISGVTNGSIMAMKKGKDNVPPQMRAQYKRQREMQAQREQMISATQPGEDNMPVFNLFARTKRANLWYPCGSFKGDQQSKGLCENYAAGGFFAGLAKKQLDSGIAGTLYRDKDRLTGTIVRVYPQLMSKELEFGYKLAFKGLSDEKITIVEPKESKGLLDNIKGMFG